MGKVIKMIDLWNMVERKEIKDKQKFRVTFRSGIIRDIYYVESEGCSSSCFRDCSNDFWWDEVFNLNDEVEILDEEDEIDIQSIEEIDVVGCNIKVGDRIIPTENEINDYNIIKINQLIKAVKQLDNKLKEK